VAGTTRQRSFSVCCRTVSIPSTAPAHEWRAPSWTTRLVLLGLVAVAVGALALTGGLDQVPQPPPAPLPTVAAAQMVDAGPWQAGVTNAVATTDLGQYKPRTKGNWLLAVAVRIDLRSPDSLPATRMTGIASLPELAGLIAGDPIAMALVRDGSSLAFLNPGLPERVAYIFEVAAGTPVPKQVVVALNGYTARTGWTSRRLEWKDFGERARVVVSVDNRVGKP
jgi:hypothetical protein